MAQNEKKAPLISISKRSNDPNWYAWAIRGGAVVVALLICSIISTFLTKTNPFVFFEGLFEGVFGTPRRIWNFLQTMAMLLIIAMAITPAFKMKFWNIGAEGQVLIGGLATAACMHLLGGKINDSLLIVIMFVSAIVAAAIWTVIPAICKALWNTNETLFTLMMNYIAMGLTAFMITVWVKTGSGVLPELQHGQLPALMDKAYLLNVIIVAVITIIVAIYLKYSKHGYEIEVVGESLNTAKYIGINVKKVIIRTMILSGVIAGIAGFILVGGQAHTIASSTVGGRGFTAILVSWLAQFNPITMVFTAFLVAFLERGSTQVATMCDIGSSFPKIVTGVFFFVIIASEFFINYKVKFRAKHKLEQIAVVSSNDGETNKEVKEVEQC